MTGAFDGIKVLEVGGLEPLYAGKLLADQGADVVLVEPQEGHPARRLPPHATGGEDDISSTAFAYLAGHKRSLSLSLGTPEGSAALLLLMRKADIVLAGGRPSELRSVGIIPESVTEELPDLVLTTVTPFGWTGPYAEFHADDLVLEAMGGFMSMGGYPNSRPLRAPCQQSYVAAGLFAATATSAALLAKEDGRGGQHVDVSVQESVVMALENSAQFYDLEGVVRGRHGGTQVQAARGVYECADGHVYLMVGVRAEAKFWRALLQWMDEERTEGRESLAGDKWLERDYVESTEAKETFIEVFHKFCEGKAKSDLYDGARQRGIPLTPVNDMNDVLNDAQLRFRQFLVDVDDSEWSHGPAVAAGAPYRMIETPWSGRYSPPTIGADRHEIRKEWDVEL